MNEYEAKQILDALRDYYDESIFITDGNGVVIFINELGAKRLNSTVNEIMGKDVRDLMKSGMYEKSTTLQAIQTKKESIATLNPSKKDSNVSHSVPVLDDKGNVIMVVTNNMSLEHSKEWESILTKEREITARLRRELDYIKEMDDTKLIANDPKMTKIFESIDIIAPTDSNVVIIGESGTGKDVLAKYIHLHSLRADNAFISVNCAAIPENLLESELFGYEGGAFTGALSKGKIGLFEAASGGTLFLDEIGEMPISLQSKLLSAIESREIRRVGGVKNINIDCRIICATNRDLNDMVNKKEFRDDLYYRLSVFTLYLPPLRERKSDIIPLAESFLEKLNYRYGTKKYIGGEARDTMLKHKWPGNIRELKNVVERIFVVSYGDELEFTPTPMADIPDEYYENEGNILGNRAFSSLKEYMDFAEKQYIDKIMRECNGSVSETARKLGIHRSALYRKTHKE